ncbi:Serine/threonine protein kinase [Lentisphaera araneosa HTCC2155]|uniref:Serine/threonine protein kinase n=1 Tax=Lentisphaera araneosa HTCC2155 TaxID=313628 RepID=A6DPP5_9BACT|nr:protein kinase [Lentisphaera araneosa]EDM26340.1 Serine/threonine protein kinase [Lentisphaera araneosa HTCC2155]
MKFILTCKHCLYQITLDSAEINEQYPCLNCQSEIQIRPDSMAEGVDLNEDLTTVYEINDDGFSKLFVSFDKNEGQLFLTRVFDKSFYSAVSSPNDVKDIMEASSTNASDNHLAILHSAYFDQYLYQVMPYMKLESIEEIIDNDFLWSPLQSLDLCYDILESLDHAYSITGSGHFNLTPHNIFIDNDGLVKFFDFSLAPQLLQDSRFASCGFNIFDIYYTSPELVQGLHYPDQSSDLYSLGHCIYYMVTGLTPLGPAEDKSEILKQELTFPNTTLELLDEEFLQIIKNITHKERNHRFQSYRQLINAIDQYYNSIGHVRLKQMEGEKTLLYQSQHFIQHVLPQVKKKPKSLTIKSKANYNSEIIRQKISTQAYLPKEFKTKIIHPHQTKKRRLQQRPHSQMLNRSKTAGKAKKRRSLLTYIIVAAAVLTICAFLLIHETKQIPPYTPLNSKPIIISQNSNENQAKTNASVDDIKNGNTNLQVRPKESSVNFSFYKEELNKELPNFDKILQQMTHDLQVASEDDAQKLMLIQKTSHQRLNEQKKRVLNRLESKTLPLIKENKKSAAIKIVDNYSDYLAQKTSLERQQISNNIQKAQPNLETPKEDKLQLLALQLVNNDIAGAIKTSAKLKIPGKEKTLQSLNKLIQESNKSHLLKRIFTAILSSNDPIIPINYQGGMIDAEFNSYNFDAEHISVKVYHEANNLNLNIPFKKLNPRYLVTWIEQNNTDEQAFLRFIFLLQNDDYTEAYRYLTPYQGPLAQSLKPLVQQLLNSELEMAYEILFKNFHQKFGSEINFSGFSIDNQIALIKLIKELQKQYQLADFTLIKKDLIAKYLTELESKTLPPIQHEIIVGSDSQFKLPRLALALNNKNTTIRLLPGIYKTPIVIKQNNIQLIGCNGVQIHTDILIQATNCELKNLNLHSGNIIIDQNIQSIKILNTNLKNGSFKLSPNTENIEINNCIFNGISIADSAKKINIQNSLIFPNNKLKSSVSGSPKRTQFLNCIFIADNTPIFTNLQKYNDFKLRYCLFSSDYYLVKDQHHNIAILNELKPIFSQINFCLKDQSKFMNQRQGDFRLSPKSPGYLKGYQRLSIGVQMNDTLILLY